MAKTDKRDRERKGSSSSNFLGCFGFSRKRNSDKPAVAAEDGVEKNLKKNKKQSRWLFSSKFRLKNREIKPAPIEETTVKPISCVEDETDKQKPVPVISRMAYRNNISPGDKIVNQETKKTKLKEIRELTTDRSKPMEQIASSSEDTCPKRISKSTRDEKPDLKPSRERNGSRVEKFDPVIGISIITLTLMVVLIWGRLFAILCTSALCYFLPRIRDATASEKRKRSGDGNAAFLQDLNSESYKRKVVLDGFLGRQNRVSLL
ncbi:unnamed protein product [Cochlearia groenlandica]